MSCKVFYFSLLALSLTACGSVNNKQALGDFDYQNLKEAKGIVIPANLDTPKQSNEYFITNNINHAGPVGEKMDIRAPSLVMPVASSSRVVEESGVAIIWFDQVLENQNLMDLIEGVVKAKLNEDGVGYSFIDEDPEVTLGKVMEGATSLKETSIKREGIRTAIIESDWYHEEVDDGWIFEDVVVAKSKRFRFQILAKSHGRSVSLRVSLVDFLQTDYLGGSKTMDPIDQQRAEKSMLNELIASVDYAYRVQQRKDRLIRANQKLVKIGENVTGEAAYIVELGIDDLWNNMPLFFEKHGFTITDLSEENKIYYVDFVKPETSIWDSIWGEDNSIIDVDEVKYQFVLSQLDDIEHQTAVTIYKEDGTPLTLETLERVFPAIEPTLSFREIF
ncbi:outer membrane protein assembly factor BamC [Colwellia sp. E2M01]|uniref:outer membrane protein assembly factor BamC n=1 Tax=Colwellia sp. E2M01 TaxID=2841561 RepID=UPI001C08C102|nr:outer membrane protein assembly factor BamC [Colwellia sp. E2M01]MBU2871279.1 outer membrane protein assembly factor BamC [Colwellia sp. E2M01]